MAQVSLRKGSFLALAAIGWADGALRPNEATGLVRAATACGLSGADLEEIERATRQRVELAAADVQGLPRWDQVLTYALASWLSCLDGVRSTDERGALQLLGDALGLEEALRVRAAAAAADIACLPQGGRPEAYDFVKLVERLRERMPQLTRDP